MAKLKLYEYPHPILKEKALSVEKVDDELRSFLDDMLETMYAEHGVGLAAPQVGVLKRAIVIDVAREDKKAEPLFIVNPEIIWHSEEKMCNDEGCLSIPDQRAEVERFEKVGIKFFDYDGKEREILADGIFSIALQHEIDHLDGILYIDHLSRLKRRMLLKKLQKYREEQEEK
jgi:peptide deformylase